MKRLLGIPAAHTAAAVLAIVVALLVTMTFYSVDHRAVRIEDRLIEDRDRFSEGLLKLDGRTVKIEAMIDVLPKVVKE